MLFRSKLQSAKLTPTFDFQTHQTDLGVEGQDWLLIGGISPHGSFWLSSSEKSFRPEPGWTLLYFASPAETRSGASNADSSAEANPDGTAANAAGGKA